MFSKNKIFLLLLMGVMILSLVIGCQSNEKSVEELVTEVIEKNLKYVEEENIDKYMTTMHPNSPVYEKTEQTMEKLVKVYDLEYKLQEVNVISKKDDEVKIEVVQITKKIKGPQFRDNQTKATHILKKDDKGQWKIYNTKINNIEYLD